MCLARDESGEALLSSGNQPNPESDGNRPSSTPSGQQQDDQAEVQFYWIFLAIENFIAPNNFESFLKPNNH